MKKFKFVFLSSALLTASFVVTSCGGGGGGDTPVTPKFNFTPIFESGRSGKLYVGETETLSVVEVNAGEEERKYTYELVDGVVELDDGTYVTYLASDYVKVDAHLDGKSFTVTPKATTVASNSEVFEIGIYLREKTSGKGKTEFFSIGQRYPKANTGYNFSSDDKKKEEILGKLEEYAMKNYLTGITLFENGGYVRYSPRVHLGTEPSTKYVTGYGFGVLTEGYLDDSWTPTISGDEAHKKYLQSAASSDPGNISGWNAEGSQVADLYGYITSSFWGTKLNAAKNGYEWYSVLAKDDCLDPIPLDDPETATIHKQYRVYVKTGDIAYNYIAESDADGNPKAGAKFHRRPVVLEDYMTTFQVLLTQKCNLFRGSEFASDTSYGLKGAYSYFRKTKDASSEEADKQWTKMQQDGKIGIVSGHDEKGDYIDFEFLNPIDQFTAKYTLSSNLYSPLPKEFLTQVGASTEEGGWVGGASIFGTGTKEGTSAVAGTILANTLCLGPYYLESWKGDQETFFKRDDRWFEYVQTKETDRPRYRIPGVHVRVVSAATQQDDAIFNEFLKGTFDSTGIPVSRFKDKLSSDLKVEGDATFKLNVNSLDQTQWDEIFWSNNPKYDKVQKPDQRYTCKDIMSNKHFLNGLFWSINREEFAKDRGVNASCDYFSNAYMSDPINGKSYNKSKAHQDAQDAFDPNLASSLGYNSGKATAEFDLAVTELVKQGKLTLGTKTNPTPVTIDIQWMYKTDETTYGQDIANYFKKAFNNEHVGEGCVVLDVKHYADADWQQVYNEHLQVGCFDLGFGAISGNTLAPLNFLEVLKSDNSSGFTLNWGTDTSIVDPDDPIVFEVEENGQKVMKEWSFDAAWAAADHGSIVKDGEAVESVNHAYTNAPVDASGRQTNRMANGASMTVDFGFVKIDEGATFDISRVELFLVGYGSLTIDSKFVEILFGEDGKTVVGFRVNFDNTEIYEEEEDPTTHEIVQYTFSQYINHLLFVGLKNAQKIKELDPVKDKDQIDELKNPFAYNYYFSDASTSYWYFEVWYTITIKGSVPTENSVTVDKTNISVNSSAKYSLAK